MEKTRFFNKNRLFLIFVILMAIIAISFTSCVKPDDPEPDPASSYTVKIVVKGLGGTVISPSSEEIKVSNGLPTKIVILPDPGYRDDSITINGVKVPLNNHKYDLWDVSDEDHYTVEVKFKVDYNYILTQYTYWKQDSLYQLERDGLWTPYKLWGDPIQPQFAEQYLATGRLICYKNGAFRGDIGWRLDEDENPMTLHKGVTHGSPNGETWIVEELTPKRLVIKKTEYDLDGFLAGFIQVWTPTDKI